MVDAWKASARCAGHQEVMFSRYHQGEARALCASCPVAAICLWSTMVAERDDPHDYRYGMAGGLGAGQRRQLATTLTHAEMDERLRKALAEPILTKPWQPPVPRYRRRRRCPGCGESFRQPKMGGIRIWCSPSCYYRDRRRKEAAALPVEKKEQRRAEWSTRKRRQWSQLPEEQKDQRRQAMRARWNGLTDEQREEVRRRKREQYRAQRETQLGRTG